MNVASLGSRMTDLIMCQLHQPGLLTVIAQWCYCDSLLNLCYGLVFGSR